MHNTIYSSYCLQGVFKNFALAPNGKVKGPNDNEYADSKVQHADGS